LLTIIHRLIPVPIKIWALNPLTYRNSVLTQFSHWQNKVAFSVPDPKLIISDPDPQIENQEFGILDPDPTVTWDGEKKWSILVIMKTQMGWNLELFKYFKYCVWNYDEFVHFLVHFITYF